MRPNNGREANHETVNFAVWGGGLGPIREVHCWTNRPQWAQGVGRPRTKSPTPARLAWDLWLGPAPERSYDPASDVTSALHRRVVEEGWTLERFCLAPELRNIYSQFLWGFPLQRFHFVGLTESYENDLRYFSTAYLGREFEPRQLNQRDVAGEAGGADELEAGTRAEVEQFHAADMALYKTALDMRAARIPGVQ